MESTPLPPPIPTPTSYLPSASPAGGGCLNELGWYASGFVLPIASLSFYRRAVRRSTGSAVLFFLLFMAVVTLVTTIGVTYKVSLVSNEIRRVFATGNVPEITITGGVASVKGPQTVVLVDSDRTFIAIDLTGKYTDIDRTRYSSGFVLTRTDLYIFSTQSQSQSQTLPLSQVQQMFQQDPLLINADTMASAWQSVTAISSLFIFLGLAFWNMVIRLIYLTFLALIVWGVVSLFHINASYGFVLTVGIFAFVPVIYLIDIIDRLGRSFFLLQTLLLLVVWGLGLYAALAKNGLDFLGPDRPLRSWRALIGIPMLVILALDAIFTWNNGGWFDLFAVAITFVALVGVGLYTRPASEPESGFPTGGAAS
jgi:hypothetical protein